eukprot:403368280
MSLREQWKTESMQEYAKSISDSEFKNNCVNKIIRRIERDYETKTLRKNQDLPSQELLSYQFFKINEERMRLVNYLLMSVAATSFFVVSRMPNTNIRLYKVAFYAAMSYSLYKENKILKNYFLEQNFREVALKNLEFQELKRLYRSYQIKKSEIDQDKKALDKYKFDPQSYH